MGEPNFFGDKESSIHMDGTRNEMDGFLNDMSESSISMNPFPIIPHSSNGPKSKMSMSQTSSARKGTKGKKGGPASVAEGSIKSSAKGTKKKKKSSQKDDKSDGDTSRTLVLPSPVEVQEEIKVEEPVIPERPRKQFIQPEKITLMDEGVDLLRK